MEGPSRSHRCLRLWRGYGEQSVILGSMDRERAHLVHLVYDHRKFVRNTSEQIYDIFWADGRLYFYTGNHGIWHLELNQSRGETRIGGR